MNKSDRFIKYIGSMGYTNQLASSIFTFTDATTAEGMRSEARRLILRLLKERRLSPIPEHGETNHTKYRYYKLTNTPRLNHPRDKQHEQMRLDLQTAIYRAYNEKYELTFSYPKYKLDPKYKFDRDGYAPDFRLDINGYCGNNFSRTFLVEVESGQKSAKRIFKEKIEKMKALDFKANGLPKDTIFLLALSCYDWNKFWRPLEFQGDGQHTDLKKKTREAMADLLSFCKDLPPNFWFMYHDQYPRIYQYPTKAIAFVTNLSPKNFLNN